MRYRRISGSNLDNIRDILLSWFIIPIIILICIPLLFILKYALSLLVWYMTIVQSITGFENQSLGLIFSLFAPPMIFFYLIEKVTFKKLK